MTDVIGAHTEATTMWTNGSQRPVGYKQLHWVNALSLRDPFIEIAQLDGTEAYVDVGCGTGAILEHVAPHVRTAVGVDLSPAMLEQVDTAGHPNIQLVVADATKPIRAIPEQSADLVTARMMLHDLPDPHSAIRSALELVRPGGLYVPAEYVTDTSLPEASRLAQAHNEGRGETSLIPPRLFTPASAALNGLHRTLFGLKHEPDRYLWSSDEFAQLVADAAGDDAQIETFMSVAPANSVANWLGNSGFDGAKQAGLQECLDVDQELRDEAGMVITLDGKTIPGHNVPALAERYRRSVSEGREALSVDALLPRAFAYIAVRVAS